MFKKQNGITLISLIITIIIMLILAGVGISTLFGENAVVEKSITAAEKVEVSEIKEVIDINTMGNGMLKYVDTEVSDKIDMAHRFVEQGKLTIEDKIEIIETGKVTKGDTVLDFDKLDKAYMDGEWDDYCDINWYDESKTEFNISKAEELVGLSKLVNEGNTFKNKTINLVSDIDLLARYWTPIGCAGRIFLGNFNGNGHKISNLRVEKTLNDYYAGLFGITGEGEIYNFVIENVNIKGDFRSGAVASHPGTTKYSNIQIIGDIRIHGLGYVGGAFGHNVYAKINNVDVIGNPGSYVYANSGIYRTYVGGIAGFLGEEKAIIQNCDAEIDVYGSTCDLGGISGNIHYGNTIENCTYKGNLRIINLTDNKEQTDEIGAITGISVNSELPSTIKSCTAEVYSAHVHGEDVLKKRKANGGKRWDGDLMLTVQDVKINGKDVTN